MHKWRARDGGRGAGNCKGRVSRRRMRWIIVVGLASGTGSVGLCDWTWCLKLRCLVGLGSCETLLSGSWIIPMDVYRSTYEADGIVGCWLTL